MSGASSPIIPPGVASLGILAIAQLLIVGAHRIVERQAMYRYAYPAIGGGLVGIGLLVLGEQLGVVSFAGGMILAYGFGYRRRFLERSNRS